MKIQQSREDYLETILVLQNRLGKVRSIDIANEFGYSKASVSRAMKILREKGFITMDENNYINFTDKGLDRATEIYERHQTITKFFQNILGLSKEISAHDACKVEHVISDETFEALKDFLNKYMILNKS